ncbi:MAG: hypothetical protein EZS28_038597, partial [Streblomastix strix]
LKLVRDKNFPISIINNDPTNINFTDIDGTLKKISLKQSKHSTISLTQVLENGIYALEAEFNNSGDGFGTGIGIVRDSYNIPSGVYPRGDPHRDHIIVYRGNNSYPGEVDYKQEQHQGNTKYIDKQKVKAEYDSFKGTLVFFNEGKQQPVFITGIKEKVRFVVYLYNSNSSCTIHYLKKLVSPSSAHVANEKAISW